jgi:hypothetical protein
MASPPELVAKTGLARRSDSARGIERATESTGADRDDLYGRDARSSRNCAAGIQYSFIFTCRVL